MKEPLEFLNKLNQVIEVHLDESDFSVTDVCRAMNMSRTSLHRHIYEASQESVSYTHLTLPTICSV